MKHPKTKLRRRNAAVTLVEVVVVSALMALIGAFVLQLYMSAHAEFELTKGTISMAQHTRKLTTKILPLLTSAMPIENWDESGILIPPALAGGSNLEYYEVDFMCSKYVVQDPGRTSRPGWNATQKFWLDPEISADPRTIYEPDDIGTAEFRREPSAYRYRILWRPYGGETANDYPNVPRRSVVFERMETRLGFPNPTLGAGALCIARFGGPWPNPNPLVRTPIPNITRKVLASKISLFTVKRIGANLQLRIRVYNVDPEVRGDTTNPRADADSVLEDSFMRHLRGPNRQTFKAYEVNTSINLPTSTIQ